MAAKTGRKRFTPDPVKIVEGLGDQDLGLLKSVLGEPAVCADLDGAWLKVQEERMLLAAHHLAVGVSLNAGGTPGKSSPEKRSVISRAYYAMFCAARAALSYHKTADKNEHSELPKWIAKSPLGPRDERDRVIQALTRFRAARNEADYSPFYPRPLGRDARDAIAEAKAVIRICKRWVKSEAKSRGRKSTL